MTGMILPLILLAWAPAPAVDDLDRGIVALQSENYGGAIVHFTASIEKEPGATRGYFLRALARSSREEYDKAAADYDEILRRDPNNVDAYVGRGLCSWKKRDYTLALRDYREALRLEPGNETLKQSVEGIAEREERRARSSPDPAGAKVARAKGIRAANLGDFDTAIARFAEASKLDDDDDLSDLERGKIHLARGLYSEAIMALPSAPSDILVKSYSRALAGFAMECSGGYLVALGHYRAANQLSYQLRNSSKMSDFLDKHIRGLEEKIEFALGQVIGSSPRARAGEDLATAAELEALIRLYEGVEPAGEGLGPAGEVAIQPIVSAFAASRAVELAKRPKPVAAGRTAAPAAVGAVTSPTGADVAGKPALRDDLERQILVEENRLGAAERADADNERVNAAEASRLRQLVADLDAKAAGYLRNGEKFKAAGVAATSLGFYNHLTEGKYKKSTGEAKKVRDQILDLKLRLQSLK